MSSAMLVWRNIINYGVAAQSAREKRRIVLTNQTTLLGLLYTAVSSALYVYTDFQALWPVLLSALSGALMLLIVLRLNRSGHTMWARVCLFFTAWFAVAIHSWYLSIDAGVHLQCFLGWTGAFLLTPQRKLWLLVMAGLLFISLYFVSIIYFVSPHEKLAGMDPMFFTNMYVLSALGAFAGITYVLGLFYVQSARAESMMLEAARAESAALQRSDKVLSNVLPVSIAERLKHGDERIADRVDSATILFADIVGFTRLASSMPAAELVDTLNGLFSRFDDIVADLDLEKIKTIGDAYMLGGGIPLHRVDHAEAVCHAALDMLKETRLFNLDNRLKLSLRIGIHSGPLVAGVIGRKKLAYDVWGDTVNVAARMESEGQKDRALISQATYELVRDSFECKRAGNLRISGRGRIETYQLIKPLSRS